MHLLADVDPNWLLSTSAQAMAALVAIVGGFLISRVITLAGERHQLQGRRRELNARERLARDRYDEIRSERLAISSSHFRARWLDEVVISPGSLDPATMLEWIPRGSSEDEMRPIALEMADTAKAAEAAILHNYRGAAFPPASAEELRKAGLVFAENEEAIWVAVAQRVSSDRRTTIGYQLPALSNFARADSRDWERDDQTRRIEAEADLLAQMNALRSELALLQEQLGFVARPPGIRIGVLVLAVCTCLSVVFPLTLMAFRPVPSSVTVRRIVVIAFAASAGAILAYLGWMVSKLAPPKEDTVSSGSP